MRFAAVIIALLVAVGPCLAIGTRPLPSVGVVHDFVWTVDEDIPVLIQAIKDAGCKAVRMPVRWTVVEQQPGRWDFSRTDKVIRTLRNAGIEILGILVSTPAWASGVDPNAEKGFWDAYPAKDLGKWAEFVRRCVGHYKKEIGHWEVWQEEDGIDWYRPEPNAVEYAKMLRVSYKAAKKVNPHAVVALGSLQMNGIIANPWSSYRNVGFLQKLYDAGIKDYCDAINIHPYVLPTPDQGPSYAAKLVRGTLEVMKANGDGNKPLWITETGTPTNAELTEQMQADHLKGIYAEFRKIPQIKLVYWFCLRDYPAIVTGGENTMGLLATDNRRKPAFDAFRQVNLDTQRR